MPLLSNQWTALNYKDADRQRIYLKDIDCPPLWHDHLKRQIPPPLFYFNESPEAFEGPGSASDYQNGTSESPEIKIAKAGDLMSCLPPSMRAENLMCYIGHEGTYKKCVPILATILWLRHQMGRQNMASKLHQGLRSGSWLKVNIAMWLQEYWLTLGNWKIISCTNEYCYYLDQNTQYIHFIMTDMPFSLRNTATS